MAKTTTILEARSLSTLFYLAFVRIFRRKYPEHTHYMDKDGALFKSVYIGNTYINGALGLKVILTTGREQIEVAVDSTDFEHLFLIIPGNEKRPGGIYLKTNSIVITSTGEFVLPIEEGE
jgi:hypothetical protein